MIQVTTNIGGFSAALGARAEGLRQRLVSTINDLSIRLQNRILNRPDSPASDSHRRKGWLANSVRPIPASAEGNTISGGVVGGGGDAWYGRLFEDGTDLSYLIVPSTEKALAFAMHGQEMVLRAVVHPPFDKARLAFMRPPFLEMEEEIKTEITAATIEALNGVSS